MTDPTTDVPGQTDRPGTPADELSTTVPLSDEQRAKLRCRGLAGMRALLESEQPGSVRVARAQLKRVARKWFADPRLEVVRDEQALKALPATTQHVVHTDVE